MQFAAHRMPMLLTPQVCSELIRGKPTLSGSLHTWPSRWAFCFHFVLFIPKRTEEKHRSECVAQVRALSDAPAPGRQGSLIEHPCTRCFHNPFTRNDKST